MTRPRQHSPHRKTECGSLALLRLEDRLAPATFTVRNTDDTSILGSLRHAIESANLSSGPDTINIIAVGTLKLGSQLPTLIDTVGTTTITGPGAANFKIDAQGKSRIFQVDPSVAVAISGLTLQNGSETAANGGGGAIANAGLLSLSLVTISGNSVSGAASDIANTGGGINNAATGTLTLADCLLTANSSTSGSAICNFGSLSITKSLIGGANTGVAIAAKSKSVTTIDSTFIRDNTGGGIFTAGATFTLSNSTIANNTTKANGGGLENSNTGSLTIINTTISSNSADKGGGLFSTTTTSGMLSVQNSTIAFNTATIGGGVSLNGTETIFTSTIISENIGTRPNIASDVVVVLTQSAVGAGGVNDFVSTGSGNLPIGSSLGLTPLAFHETDDPVPTIRPTLASPVRDTGSNPAGKVTDARGSLRVVGQAADIGAFEINDAALLLGTPLFAIGTDVGGGTVNFYNPNATTRSSTTPFTNFAGGVRPAVADFNGDGIADLAVASGPGTAGLVRIFDGTAPTPPNAKILFELFPFGPNFTRGIVISAGDLTGDGRAELAITPESGGGARIRIFTSGTPGGFTQMADFFGLSGSDGAIDTKFRGGGRTAIGDINGDGRGDLVFAAGTGGGPRIAIFDGMQLASSGGPKLRGDFFAFEPTLRNGAYIALGDVNGDGRADLIAGGGPGGGSRIRVIDGDNLANGTNVFVIHADFIVGNGTARGGIRVAVKDLDGDGRADLLTGSGSGSDSSAITYLGSTLSPTGTPSEFQRFKPFPGFTGGIYVG